MPAVFTDTPKLGVQLLSTVFAADLSSGAAKSQARLGSEIWGNDGKRYVYARASTAINPGVTTCAITQPSTGVFTAAATGGTYTSPSTTAMAVGDEGWFSAASV